jgi:dTDP-glucose 4,6-dehydratase
MKLVITGGLGFIGSNFVRHILSKYPDYEIVNLDKVTYAGNPKNLADVEKNSRYRFVKGDICDSKIVDRLAMDADAIINFAAETHVDRSIVESGSFVKTDVLGTHTLLEAAKKHKIKKFLQISTDEVYGSIDHGSFSESSLLQPNSPYSASKAGGDMLVRAYYKTFNIPAIITRSSNNYGPYQYPEKFIPLFITNLLEGKKLPLYGDGLNVRDWLYVMDNCTAIDLVLHKGAIGEVYNIGGDCEKRNIDVVKLILKFLNKDESFIEYVNDRPGHDRRYALESAKLKKLGWKLKTNFEDGLKLTVEWYKINRDIWKSLK